MKGFDFIKIENIKVKNVSWLYEDAALVETADGIKFRIDGSWGASNVKYDKNGNPHGVYKFYPDGVNYCMFFFNCTENGYDKRFNEYLCYPKNPNCSGITNDLVTKVADAILDYNEKAKDGEIIILFNDYQKKVSTEKTDDNSLLQGEKINLTSLKTEISKPVSSLNVFIKPQNHYHKEISSNLTKN